VEVVLSGEQAEALAEQGIELAPKEIDGQTAAELSTQQAAEGYVVYRTYREPGGIKDEIEQADNLALASRRRRTAPALLPAGDRPGQTAMPGC
jgi:hypothetical protein